jgi:hypothetical protein
MAADKGDAPVFVGHWLRRQSPTAAHPQLCSAVTSKVLTHTKTPVLVWRLSGWRAGREAIGASRTELGAVALLRSPEAIYLFSSKQLTALADQALVDDETGTPG